ncbi:tetratricopeptide (TPR) repeat protein [Actinoplanes couchii]|nr:Replicase polyprotein 1ab [Actinoplanes couchii]MDR6315806.1 tetratricopeptide (TPR) repeat protein [Actinoplanes couchii]
MAPEIPEDITANDLDQEVRAELQSLARDVADKVARHLVAAGTIIDEDSEEALQHAIAARRLASRIAVVREAVGLAAYAAGDWTTAIAELRTYHRMTGRQTHLAELADCERALGRPERAIDLYRGADLEKLEKATAIELLIVAAGARGDLGQHDAAVAMLQVGELSAEGNADWAARLRYAFADSLLAAGRRDEAREWFSRAAAVDEDQVTDAAERLLELDGVTIEGDDHDEDEDDEAGTDGAPSNSAADSDSDDEDDSDDDDEDDSDEYDDDDDDDLADDEDEDDLDDEDEQDDDKVAAVAATDVNTDALVKDAPEGAVSPETFGDADEVEAEKVEAEKVQADKVETVKAEAGTVEADKLEAGKAEGEKAEAGKPVAPAEAGSAEKAAGDEGVAGAADEEKPKA